MGVHRPRRTAARRRRGSRLTNRVDRVDRVVPDVPALDRALDYRVPAELGDLVEVGTIVRVPLHGRRVRGWVVDTNAEPEAPPDRLRPVIAAVSAGPSSELVDLATYAAWRWAGPRTTFLRAASPPNVVQPGPRPEPDVAVFPPVDAPLELPDGRTRLVLWPPAVSRADLVAAMIEREGSTIVIAPDPAESEQLAIALRERGHRVVLTRSGLSAAARTEAWNEARRGACVVVSGRVGVLAPVPDLRGVIVLDDADEALAEERAPAWHARDLGAERARRREARFSIVTPAPTVEAVELTAPSVVAAPRSVVVSGWPRVRVVDMRDEAPGAGLLSAALGPALHRAIDAGGTALCVLNRRGRAHLLVCRACDEIARCQWCDARVSEVEGALHCDRCGRSAPMQCRRCGAGTFRKLRPGVTGLRDGLAALLPHARVVAVDAASAPLPAFDVAVGTEAVLHRASAVPVHVVAFLDFDQELLAPRFRAAEQALWLLVRAARRLRPGAGGEVLVQSRVVDHEVLRAVTTRDVMPVVEADRRRRRELAFPPFGGLAEVSGDAAAVEAACRALRDRLVVLGPASGRALLRAPSVPELCDALDQVDLAAARALGRLRVDVDPLRV